MNPEKYIAKKQVEAEAVNTAVDEFYVEHPRSRREADDIADEIIKEDIHLPIQLKNLPEDLRDWYGNLWGAGVRILKDGFMDVTIWRKPEGGGKRKLERQRTDGLDSTLRMQDHILSGYRVDDESNQSEYTKLESIEEVIAEANTLLNSWSNVAEVDKEELKEKLALVVLQLEQCRNEFKVAVHDQTEAVVKLRDSRGRENPGALAARTVGALNQITKRFGELQLIMPLIAMRKELLLLEERRIAGVLRKADSKITLVLNHAVFSQDDRRPAETRLREYELLPLRNKLEEVIAGLNTIHAAPYYQQAVQAKFFLEEVIKTLHSREATLAERENLQAKLADIQFILRSQVDHFG